MFEYALQMSYSNHDSVKFVQSCSIVFSCVFDSAALLQMHPVQMRWLVCVLSFEAADLSPEVLLVPSKIIQHHLLQIL